MKLLRILAFAVILTTLGFAQSREQEREQESLFKPSGISGIQDRAGGTHNASNVGLFFENRGKLYPRRVSQGPSGEFPINSAKNYVFRINPMVGIPGNVVQCRYTDSEEWEAAFGFVNRNVSKIAFSDDPSTWPAGGWPVKDAAGNPLFYSDQDSYAVYNDSGNTRSILNIEVHQIGYSYGIAFAKNLIFFTYKVVNKSNKQYDSLYFGIYADIDVGNISGGDPEYGDDKIGFDKARNFLYFHDDGKSNEWAGGTTGYMGISFLSTPKINGVEAGITDMHYNLYDDDRNIDTVQYGIMSSSVGLQNSTLGSKFFHLGAANNIHFDDPSTIPAKGLDILANMSSGPYSIAPGDTLTFVTAIVAGDNLTEALQYADNAMRVKQLNYQLSKPPTTPTLYGYTQGNKSILYWNDIAEKSIDNFSGEQDFEGYRIYRSQDNGVTWSKLADFDIKNKIGFDNGLQYSFADSSVVAGFEYWYSVTAYDRGDSAIASLESAKGNSLSAINLISLTPYSQPLGYKPVSVNSISQVGTGTSNYTIQAFSVDSLALIPNTYDISLGFASNKKAGNLKSKVEIVVTDSSISTTKSYGFNFLTNKTLEIVDLETDIELSPSPKSYASGATYTLPGGFRVKISDDPAATADEKPEAGDYIIVSRGVNVVRNATDTIIANRSFAIGQNQATPDGLIFKFVEPNLVKEINRVGGTDNIALDVAVTTPASVVPKTYVVQTLSSTASPAGVLVDFVVSNTTDTAKIYFTQVGNNQTLSFGGLTVTVKVTGNSTLASTNTFNVVTQSAVLPSMRDKFRITLKGSSIDKQSAIANISSIKVVPNPYVVASLWEPEFGELRQEPLRQIQFINLPTECTIYIFSVDGDMVKTINHNALSGTAVWDLRSDGGREIAPGVYIYLVKSDGAEYKSTFAIIK